MPPSPSTSRSNRGRIVAGVLAALAVLLVIVVVALPASLIVTVLPATVTAGDFSGGLWHGAAGRLLIKGQDAGAIEWRLHPGDLLTLGLGLDATWAKGAFSLSANGSLTPRGITVRAVNGGGAIEDIAALTGMTGWRGTAAVAIDRLEADGDRLRSLSGTISVSGLHGAAIGNDEDLGGYLLRFSPGTAPVAGDIVGQLTDTGGPLEVTATLQLSSTGQTGTLTGTARERSQASGALRRSLEELARLSPRDAQGRVPLDVEFAY